MLESGTKLGPYEILSPLPASRAGEAYKASDSRRNRSVVVTLLPPHVSERAEAVERFKREARTITSLSHPNICAPDDVGHENGTDFFVTDDVEGETLAQRLARSPLAVDEALKVAIAIADALDKAHRQGVTHRGLNPSNIVLTPDGPKLLDFGLGRATALEALSGPAGSASSLPTRPAGAAGAALSAVPTSAAPYLAPEQWEGREGDARSDVYAVGAVLYEMVVGKPAFEGKNQAILIAAIATVDPDPVSKATPAAPALDYVVERCLMKDPARRMQTAWDLMGQLQWIAETSTPVGVPAPLAGHGRKQDRAVWIALAAALLVAAILAPYALSSLRSSPEPEEVRFVVSNMGNGPVPLSISPNGRWITNSRGAPNPGVDGLLLGSVTPQVLIGDSVMYQPFWSPDSRSMAFFDRAGKLKKAEVSGGPSQNICDTPNLAGGTWNSDGVILFSGGGVIQRVLAAGGQPAPITELDKSQKETEHIGPYFLPDGRHYLYTAVSAEGSESAIYAGSLDSKERKRLLAAESKASYAAPGYLLFNRGGTVFAQPFDAGALELSGEAVRIADGVPALTVSAQTSVNLSRTASFAVSQAGVFVYRTAANAAAAAPGTNLVDLSLVWFDRSGSRIGAPAGTPGGYAGVDLSPDGKQVALHRHEGNGGDSWLFDLALGRMQRLTFDATQENTMPVWSPDGTRIAFGSTRSGKPGLYVKLADGTGAEELIVESSGVMQPMSWSPDGKLLVYVADAGGPDDVFAVPLSGDRKPIPILQTPFNEQLPQVSSDGKWLAYASDETGRNEIYVKPFPEGPGKWQVSTEGGQFPRWRGDGKELFFQLAPNIMAAEIRVMGSSVQSGVPRVLFGINNPSLQGSAHSTPYHRYDVSADGQRFLLPQLGGAGGPNVAGGLAATIAALADQNGAGTTGVAAGGVSVVLNWTRMMTQK